MNDPVPEEEKIALVYKLFSISLAQREKYIQSVLKTLQDGSSKDEVLQCLTKMFETIDAFKIRLN